MTDLSLTTIQSIGWIKINLLLTIVLLLVAVKYQAKPWVYSLIASLSISSSYLIMALPLQKMFWGNSGDEMFIAAFLTNVIHGNYFTDFYYLGLPTFYPPLYFWITGTIARFFTTNAITASKVGISGTLLLWFIGTHYWKKLAQKTIPALKESFYKSPWFWTLIPVLYFLVLDFDTIMLKPYETVTALWVCLWVVFFSSFIERTNRNKEYISFLFLGISGGLLFLTFYFWWFIIIPAMFVLAFMSSEKKRSLLDIMIIGTMMFAVASPYIIPLFLSYRSGIENWQGNFFVPEDFSTFMPFAIISWKSLLYLVGLVGLFLFWNRKPIKTAAIVLLCAFAYQFANIIHFLIGGKSQVAGKPFLFLGSGALMLSASYLLIWFYDDYMKRFSVKRQRSFLFLLILLSLTLWPQVSFIDNPDMQSQLEKDLQASSGLYLADEIQNHIPNYSELSWLTSGIPEINAYIPLHYYIAYNPHFSHHAAKYSERMSEISYVVTETDPDLFRDKMNSLPIDALLLYKNSDTEYPLFFWQDNFPNGGKELRLSIKKDLVDSLNWNKVYDDKEWIVYTKN